jgi:hypothetical protein
VNRRWAIFSPKRRDDHVGSRHDCVPSDIVHSLRGG